MNEPTEIEITDTARQLLKATEHELDADTLRRLRQARHTALETIDVPRQSLGWIITRGVALAGVVLAFGLTLWFMAPGIDSTENHAPLLTASDFDLLTDAENPEFYVELDFYDWLAETSDAG